MRGAEALLLRLWGAAMPVDDVPAAWGLALSLALVSEFCVVIAAQSFRFAALVDRRVRWRWYVFPVVFAVPIAGSITVLNYMTAPAAIVTATRSSDCAAFSAEAMAMNAAILR